MMTLKNSANPYNIGLRPKRFFSATIELNKREIRKKDVRSFDPNWSKKVKA